MELFNKGVKMNKKWTNKDIKTLIEMFNEGTSVSVIAKKLKRSSAACYMKINALQKKGELPYKHKSKGSGRKKKVKKEVDYKKLYKQYAEDFNDVYGTKSKKEPTTKVVLHTSSKGLTNTQRQIENECKSIMYFLLKKNEAYGDSAIAPIRIFSKSDAQEQIKVRIDDKLNRLMQGKDILESDEDVIKDLIGYLILLLVQLKE
tara:strand:- start:3206 stop:3814 length:609 start_codon:yes stop_codon:yes gene_type:complete